MRQVTTNISTKNELAERRPVLLFAVLPLSLLLIGSGLAPFLTHRAQASATPQLRTTREEPGADLGSPVKQREWIHRSMALHTVDRWEKESQRSGGETRISALDLRRLRNALHQGE
ncbi:MAG: hypothetical protein V4671_04165 [Armatimonadota bacterium]